MGNSPSAAASPTNAEHTLQQSSHPPGPWSSNGAPPNRLQAQVQAAVASDPAANIWIYGSDGTSGGTTGSASQSTVSYGQRSQPSTRVYDRPGQQLDTQGAQPGTSGPQQQTHGAAGGTQQQQQQAKMQPSPSQQSEEGLVTGELMEDDPDECIAKQLEVQVQTYAQYNPDFVREMREAERTGQLPPPPTDKPAHRTTTSAPTSSVPSHSDQPLKLALPVPSSSQLRQSLQRHAAQSAAEQEPASASARKGGLKLGLSRAQQELLEAQRYNPDEDASYSDEWQAGYSRALAELEQVQASAVLPLEVSMKLCKRAVAVLGAGCRVPWAGQVGGTGAGRATRAGGMEGGGAEGGKGQLPGAAQQQLLERARVVAKQVPGARQYMEQGWRWNLPWVKV